MAAFVAAAPARADMTISENLTLTEDADWRDQGVVTIEEGATLDLAGHVLQVSALAGAGSIVDSSQYRILEYIEATGAQKITTDYVPGSATQIDALFAPTDASPLTLFGVRWGSPNFLAMGTGGNWHFFGDGSIISSLTANRLYRFTVGPGTKVSLLDGRTGARLGGNSTASNLTNTNGGTLSICHVLNNSGKEFFGKHKVYSVKVWHDGALRLDFVPAMNADGVAGLFDRQNDTFHPSETDTGFIAGTATGASFSKGVLIVEAADETALADFAGSVAETVRMALDGDCTLAADADWRRFALLQIDGTVKLAGHDLRLANLYGKGSIDNATTGDAYDRLEYVESTSEQVVNTGVEAVTDTAVELDFTFLPDNAKESIILGSGAWGGTAYMLAYCPDFIFFGGDANAIYKNETAGTRYIFTTTPGTSPKGTVKLFNQATGSQLCSVTRSLDNNRDDKNLCLFGPGDKNAKRLSKIRVHSCKIWKGGELKRNLVPARDSATGKAGLLDVGSGEFLVSSTGVDLVAGPVVAAAGEAGSLHVEVAEGKAVAAESVALSGGLAFVKEGAGTLVFNCKEQTYTGGTEVRGGTLASGVFASYVFGEAWAAIAVGSAGNVDLGGNAKLADYRWTVAAGGTIVNSGAAVSGPLAVSGVFSPVATTGGFTAKLQDGSTLDFTKWEGEFPVASPAISYAADANIAVKLEPATSAISAHAKAKDAGTGVRGGYLLAWSKAPSGIAFALDAATGSRFEVSAEETGGLRVSVRPPLVIYIR